MDLIRQISDLPHQGDGLIADERRWTALQRAINWQQAHNTFVELLNLQDPSQIIGISLVTFTLIWLNDVLQELSQNEVRVSVRNDLIFEMGKEKDQTSLINAARTAVCHINSGRSYSDGGTKWQFVWIGPDTTVRTEWREISNRTGHDWMVTFADLNLYLHNNIGLGLQLAAKNIYLSAA